MTRMTIYPSQLAQLDWFNQALLLPPRTGSSPPLETTSAREALFEFGRRAAMVAESLRTDSRFVASGANPWAFNPNSLVGFVKLTADDEGDLAATVGLYQGTPGNWFQRGAIHFRRPPRSGGFCSGQSLQTLPDAMSTNLACGDPHWLSFSPFTLSVGRDGRLLDPRPPESHETKPLATWLATAFAEVVPGLSGTRCLWPTATCCRVSAKDDELNGEWSILASFGSGETADEQFGVKFVFSFDRAVAVELASQVPVTLLHQHLQ